MSDFPDYKTVATSSLIPYARNSRTHSDEQVAQIAASIREFGFLNPIIVDGDNGIIAGHGRVMAAQKLGMESLPCIEASHLTDAQRKAYVIADNKLALNAGWDGDLLRIELDVGVSIPASWSNKRKAEAKAGREMPAKKPDADNILKSICDSLNGIAYRDDAQIVRVVLGKRYMDEPQTMVAIKQIGGSA